MDPAKKNIVSELIKTYDIKTAKDIQEALKDLLGETLQDMLEAEMNEHLGYEKYTRDDESNNYRNGYKTKKVRSSMGELEINVSQDLVRWQVLPHQNQLQGLKPDYHG